MPKIAISGFAQTPVRERLFHANYDQLMRLHRETWDPNTSPHLAHAFSGIMNDIQIGKAYKRTKPNRFHLSLPALREVLGERECRKLTILDVGASDGVTTLELVEALAEDFPELTAHICDLCLSLRRYRKGVFVEYRTSNGEPIMLRLGRLAWRLPVPDHRWDLLSHWAVRRYLQMPALRNRMQLTDEIPLVNPRVLQDHRITTTELNFLDQYDPYIDRFDVLRVSNVLNYFEDADLRVALTNAFSYLRPDGYLLISQSKGRPSDEVESGSIWKRSSASFTHVLDVGSGSDVREQVDGWQGAR